MGDITERENTKGDRDRWWERAACKGMDTALWYPQRGDTHGHARSICEQCPVQEQCRQEAFDRHETFGIWGGTSERQRKKQRKQWLQTQGKQRYDQNQ